MDNEDYVINCEFSFRCPRAWEALDPTSDENVRHCGTCNRPVTFITTAEELAVAEAQGSCVAANVYSDEFGQTMTTVGAVALPDANEPAAYDIVLEPGEPLNADQLKAIQDLLGGSENLMQLYKRLSRTEATLLRASVSRWETEQFFNRAVALSLSCSRRPAN